MLIWLWNSLTVKMSGNQPMEKKVVSQIKPVVQILIKFQASKESENLENIKYYLLILEGRISRNIFKY
jgi:hypothetical protein